MAFWFKKTVTVAFLCLLTPLVIKTTAAAQDKMTSLALSHYIMAVYHEDLGDIDKAIEEYKKALKQDEACVIHLSLASAYIKKNDIPQAIEELKLASELDPDAIEPHAILAILYSTQNKADLATQEYEFALKNASKAQPKNIEIYKGLGSIYLQQKKFSEAEKTFRMILDIAPNDAEAHFYLANIYDELKQKKRVEEELIKAIELKPDYHEALNYLGYLYAEEGRNLDQAEKLIRKALELDPNSGAYVDSLGWVYFRKARYKEALKELEKASALIEDPVVYDHLGDVYLKLNDPAKAKLNWEKSLKLDPLQEEVKKKLEKLK